MTALLSAEVRRLLSTRLWLWALIASLCTGGLVFVLAIIGPQNFEQPLPGVDTEAGTRLLIGIAGMLAFIPALLGTTAVTAEYRHQTITFTYLFAPKRGRVLAAKLGVYGIAGTAYGLVVAVTAAAGIGVAAAVHGVSLGLPTGEFVGLSVRLVLLMAVYMVFGAAFGALLRNQVAALVTVAAYFYLGETLLMIIPGVNAIYPFLPGGASAAITGSPLPTEAATQTGVSAPQILSAPLGVLVLLAYAAVAAVLAFATSLRRDVA